MRKVTRFIEKLAMENSVIVVVSNIDEKGSDVVSIVVVCEQL